MSIKAMWDMEIDLKKLRKQVERKPNAFYENFEDQKDQILKRPNKATKCSSLQNSATNLISVTDLK